MFAFYELLNILFAGIFQTFLILFCLERLCISVAVFVDFLTSVLHLLWYNLTVKPPLPPCPPSPFLSVVLQVFLSGSPYWALPRPPPSLPSKTRSQIGRLEHLPLYDTGCIFVLLARRLSDVAEALDIMSCAVLTFLVAWLKSRTSRAHSLLNLWAAVSRRSFSAQF